MVCPVAHPVCVSEATLNGKTFTDYFATFVADMKTSALFNTNLNLQNVPLSDNSTILTITDNVAPDLTNFAIAISSYTKTGSVSWTAAFSSPIRCWYQVQPASVGTPTYDMIQGCTDPAWCGNVRVNVNVQSYSLNSSKAFNPNTQYNVYAACTNDIPFAFKRSSVKAVGSFTIPADQTASIDVTPSKTIGSSFLSNSIFALIAFIAIFFN